jgi:hypothetical protein
MAPTVALVRRQRSQANAYSPVGEAAMAAGLPRSGLFWLICESQGTHHKRESVHLTAPAPGGYQPFRLSTGENYFFQDKT